MPTKTHFHTAICYYSGDAPRFGLFIFGDARGKVATFPLTETGAYAAGKLLQAMQYDVHERFVTVSTDAGLFSDQLDNDIWAEQIVREFNLLDGTLLHTRPKNL